MIATAAYIILPVSKVANLCVANPVAIFDKVYSTPDLYYLEKADEFWDDYDRANPVTSALGWEWYNNLLGEKNPEEQEKIEQNKKAQAGQTKGASLFDYACNKVSLKDQNKLLAGKKTEPKIKNKNANMESIQNKLHNQNQGFEKNQMQMMLKGNKKIK